MATTRQRRKSNVAVLSRFNLGCLVGLCLATLPAGAAEWGVSVGSGLTYSDNVDRVTDGDSVTVATTDFAAQIIGVGNRYDVDVEAAAVWREYLDSEYENDILPQFRGELNWAPIPEHFVWTVRDNFGQVALTPAESLQPFDRQDINIFSTGPAATLPLTQRVNLRLAGLYSDIYYEDEDIDANRISGALTVEREIAHDRFVYVRGFSDRTEFKESQYGGYDIQGYYLGYDSVGIRTAIIAEVGVEELHDGGEVDDGLYVNVDIERELGERVTATARYLSRYADAADMFALSQDLEPRLGGTTNLQVTSDPVQLDIAMLDLRWEGARTATGITAVWSNENADSLVQPDREIRGIAVRGSRRLSASTRLGAAAFFFQEERTGAVEQQQDDFTVSVDFTAELTRTLSLVAVLEHYNRNNSPADYDENRVMVLLRYTPRAITRDLPSFYERRLNRRPATGDVATPVPASANEPPDRP
ncbi:MAG: hypothetical protein M3O07_04440 [Pseudomonadota bacterium]|nr:hypothetical protein [Pseudomonadota bacterium]